MAGFEGIEGEDQFGLLEARIIELAENFKKVKREREELALTNAELQKELARREEEIRRLKERVDGLERARDLVSAKVKGLIERLEGIT
mgnify:CR=1 FL=1